MDQSALTQIEALCDALYQGSNPALRAEAQQKLLLLQSSIEYIPQCQFILNNSKNPYACSLAATSLEALITQFWNNFSCDQKIELRNYVLSHLANNSEGMPDFVSSSITRLAARITKLGWFDHQELRDYIDEVKKFLQATVAHNIMGHKLLDALVTEMNIPSSGKTLTAHRKVAVSFRDLHLYNTFQVALTTLNQLQQNAITGISPDQSKKMGTLALNLCYSCLTFDFIGTNPEESVDDVGTVQLPSNWKPLVQDTSIMQLFFDIYKASEPPRSSTALQILIQLSCVRRTLFQTEKERMAYLQVLLSGIRDIMNSKQGLDKVDNYHEFCRLLGRLKASYQLSELIKVAGFIDWLELAADFTVKSLQNWQYSMNSIHYLLALWDRLVSAVPYLPSDALVASQVLKRCCLTVVENYVKIMLESVDTVVSADGAVEDPLEDEGSLKEQMDKLPKIARLQYESFAQYLKSAFEAYFSQYEQAIAQGSAVNRQQLEVLEGKLTWIVYMTGGVVSVQQSDPRAGKTDMVWDGQLSKCMFQLLHAMERRMSMSNGQSKPDSKLEMAMLFYFQSFRKSYIVVDNAYSSSILPSMMSSSAGSTPAAHPLLAYALSSGPSDSMEKSSADPQTIFEAMNIGELPVVMNMIINKLCTNIKYWNRSNEILDFTLEIFIEFINSYNATKTLLGLESIGFLIKNHVGSQFPFLGYDNDNKYRITFYTALSRLVFSAAEDSMNSFDVFIEPQEAIARQLGEVKDLRDNTVKIAIVGLLRDLRGILDATHNKRTYNLFFDSMFPLLFPLLGRVTETWFDDEKVMTAVLKFLQEFVHNRVQRIVFDQSSANGILLFKETSSILCSFGSRILSLPVRQDIYVEKYKGIRLMLQTLTHALSGGYVNFGVFALYNDPCLQNALDVSLQMCLQIPQADVLTYLKLSKAFYAFIEVLFRNHLDVLAGLDSVVFNQLIKLTHEGLQSSDPNICSYCSTTIDNLATYMFLNVNKDKPTPRAVRKHIKAEPSLLPMVMTTLMNQLLYASHSNHWAVTRPILSLMLSQEGIFVEYENQLISSQASPENQTKLKEEFAKLVLDIQRSVDTLNRDRFTQKLTLFRLNVRQFLTL